MPKKMIVNRTERRNNRLKEIKCQCLVSLFLMLRYELYVRAQTQTHTALVLIETIVGLFWMYFPDEVDFYRLLPHFVWLSGRVKRIECVYLLGVSKVHTSMQSTLWCSNENAFESFSAEEERVSPTKRYNQKKNSDKKPKAITEEHKKKMLSSYHSIEHACVCVLSDNKQNLCFCFCFIFISFHLLSFETLPNAVIPNH